MATHSNIFAWKIPWTEEPGRLQSIRSKRVGHTKATQHTHTKRMVGECLWSTQQRLHSVWLLGVFSSLWSIDKVSCLSFSKEICVSMRNEIVSVNGECGLHTAETSGLGMQECWRLFTVSKLVNGNMSFPGPHRQQPGWFLRLAVLLKGSESTDAN